MIVWILTWIICGILIVVNGGSSSETGLALIDIISELPLFNVWLKLLGDYTISRTNPEAVIAMTAIAYIQAFVDSLFVGFVIHICNSIKKRNTVNILSSYIGAVLSFVIIGILKKSGEFNSILLELLSIGTMLFGIRILLTGKVSSRIFDVTKLWTIIVDSIYGVMVCGYITKIVMISSGNFKTLAVGIAEVMIYSVILALFGYIAYLITGKQTI